MITPADVPSIYIQTHGPIGYWLIMPTATVLYAVELTSTDIWMFHLLTEIILALLECKNLPWPFLYWCCYLLTEITWGVHLLINGITGCLITWRTLTLAVQKCGSSLVSDLNRVTWVFLKTHGFYEISPELCNASAPICGSFFF